MPSSKQRREAERRRLQRQGQRRAAQEVRRRRATLVVSIVGALAVLGVVVGFVVANTGNSSTPSSSGSPSVTTSPSATTTPTASSSTTPRVLSGSCSYPTSGTAARKVSKPATTEPTKGTVTVDVQTNRGDMTFTLDRATAPCTVGSFVSLVRQKFYDESPCPRIDTSSLFILQCGDPTGTGGGGPGYTIPDEYTGKEKYTTGVLAMATAGTPNSGGSQFFIVYKTDDLPASYTIFGHVTKGLDVVDKVAAAGDDGSNPDGGGKPKLPIELTKLTVTG